MAILGIDEVGRGPWAGPLVIGAVILPEQKPAWVDELNDSKKLSVKKREALNELILKEAAATGLGWVSSREIDELGLAAPLITA
ncbi:ribonuclease HII, partial [Candidatus Saccharibacteria bacterium]|nr:ribonuclease HII [Candidatus Saccharibacteria bacterium]